MLNTELKKIIVSFDTEGIDINKEEKDNISAGISNLEMSGDPLDMSDKPRVRQSINDELDRLNKGGLLSDEVVENITYTFELKDLKI